MEVAKLVGVDYGTKRIGVAVTDDSGSVAFPKTSLPNDRAILENIVAFVKEENASEIVIGESRNAQGNENAIMGPARVFATELERATGIPVRYEPEFYSSVEARRDLGHSFVDAGAAAIILNSYISRTKKP